MSEDVVVLLQRLCEPLETIASLTGDDLLNIGGRKIHKESGIWPFRSLMRSWHRTTRPYIINDLQNLLSEVRGVVHLLEAALIISIETTNGPTGSSSLSDANRERLQQLQQLATALRASLKGVSAQVQHYEKIHDTETAAALQLIGKKIEATAVRIEKTMAATRPEETTTTLEDTSSY